MVCVVILLMHSADCSTHSECGTQLVKQRARQSLFLGVSVWSPVSLEKSCLEKMLISAQKGAQTLELCSHNFFSTTADLLHNPKFTTLSIFQESLFDNQEGKKSMCNRNFYQYML